MSIPTPFIARDEVAYTALAFRATVARQSPSGIMLMDLEVVAPGDRVVHSFAPMMTNTDARFYEQSFARITFSYRQTRLIIEYDLQMPEDRANIGHEDKLEFDLMEIDF